MGFRFLNWIFQIFVLSEARGMEEKRADLGSREQAMSMIWESGPKVGSHGQANYVGGSLEEK